MSSTNPPPLRTPLALVPRAKSLPLREPASLPLRDVWATYTEASEPSLHSRLRSLAKCQLAELLELELASLTPKQLTLWEAKHIAKGYAPKTTYDAFYTLAAAVRLSLEPHEDVPWRIGPGRYWKPRRPPRRLRRPAACWTVEQAELLIHAALEQDRARRAGRFGEAYARRLSDLAQRVAVALFLALRNGELAGLGWDDLVLGVSEPMARIRHQAVDQWRTHYPDWKRPIAQPKGRKARQLLIHPTALLALDAQRALLDERGWYRPDGPVFPAPEGSPFRGSWRNNANGINPEDMKELARVAGVPFYTDWVTHSLRHSLATLEAKSGMDLRSIQTRTGHSSLEQLEDYILEATGLALVPSAIPQLSISFDLQHDTEPCPPLVAEEDDSKGSEPQ